MGLPQAELGLSHNVFVMRQAEGSLVRTSERAGTAVKFS